MTGMKIQLSLRMRKSLLMTSPWKATGWPVLCFCDISALFTSSLSSSASTKTRSSLAVMGLLLLVTSSSMVRGLISIQLRQELNSSNLCPSILFGTECLLVTFFLAPSGAQGVTMQCLSIHLSLCQSGTSLSDALTQWLQIGQLLAILQNIRCSYSKSDT